MLRRVDVWAFCASLVAVVAQQLTGENWLVIPWAVLLLAWLVIPARWTFGRRRVETVHLPDA